METVDWLAIEAGLWRIEQSASASAVIEAGIAVVSPGFRSSRLHEVKLSGAAAVDNIQTVVFAQVMTYNEHVPAGARVATVTPSSFEVALQEDVWDGVRRFSKRFRGCSGVLYIDTVRVADRCTRWRRLGGSRGPQAQALLGPQFMRHP